MPAPLPTAMSFDQLVSVVGEMMENADKNGFPVWEWSPGDIAADMQSYSDDILACDVSDVERAVEAALYRRRAAETSSS